MTRCRPTFPAPFGAYLPSLSSTLWGSLPLLSTSPTGCGAFSAPGVSPCRDVPSGYPPHCWAFSESSCLLSVPISLCTLPRARSSSFLLRPIPLALQTIARLRPSHPSRHPQNHHPQNYHPQNYHPQHRHPRHRHLPIPRPEGNDHEHQ